MSTEPKSIQDWVNAAHELSRSKGWYDGEEWVSSDLVSRSWSSKMLYGDNLVIDPRKIPEKLMLIVSEVSEALEAYRDNDMGLREGKDGKLEGFDAELADVLIRVFDLAGSLGIDLEYAVKMKHAFNATRPARHGGKKC